MRNANKDITLYNFYPSLGDPDRQMSKRTYIQGVSVYASTQVNVSKEGLSSADVFSIRIPQTALNETFFRPANFAALMDKSNAYTLNKGDKIVLGFADDENPTESALEKKYGYDYVVTITGITDNRDKLEPHWKVTGE